ncbi:phage holin [Siccibacter colletis]|uniref:phage holin n=1 Tax=Siccibacter colletis TaxID=1505757 RepID=UPI003CFB6558
MSEKITNAPYWYSFIAVWISALGERLTGLTLYEWVLVSGLVIGPATFLVNLYYQRRQTRAIERAAEAGQVITKPGMFDK